MNVKDDSEGPEHSYLELVCLMGIYLNLIHSFIILFSVTTFWDFYVFVFNPFNLNTCEAEADSSLSSRPAWSTE